MGYGRSGRVRPAAAIVVPGDRSYICVLRYRLPQLTRKCHGQGQSHPFPLFSSPLISCIIIYTRIPPKTDKKQWYPEVLHFCPYTPLILVGLKSDLRFKKTCIDMLKTQGLTPVTAEQGLAVAKKMGAQYMECSSKEMKGVDEVFEQAILTVVANDRRNLEAQAASTSKSSGTGGAKKNSSGVAYGSGNAAIPIGGPMKRKKRRCIPL